MTATKTVPKSAVVFKSSFWQALDKEEIVVSLLAGGFAGLIADYFLHPYLKRGLDEVRIRAERK